MKIEEQITGAALAAVKELYGTEVPEKMIQLQKTRSDFEGNLTLVTFPLLKTSHRKPEETAQELGEYLKKNCKAVADFNVVKGFLNLVIAQAAWTGLLNDINADEKFGEKRVTADSPLVMIEYSSPNTNKPLHLGHVRNNLLGWSLAQIMEANGNKVVKTNIVNDRGIHICKSMLAWQKWGNGATPESTGKKGDHLIGDYYVAFDQHYRAELAELTAKFKAEGMTDEEAEKRAKEESPLMKEAHDMLVRWEQGDEEVRALWRKMNDWVYQGFDETYKAMGVGFDKIDLEAAKEKGIYVCNNRAVNAVPVAELAVGHMITSLRRMPEADAKIKAKGVDGFNESFREYQVKGQSELSSRVIGLVGLGAIGKAAVRMLKAFGCKILYYDVFRASEDYEKENDLTFCTYEEILAQCDIISYHVPVLDTTRNMVRKETIAQMKQDAVIINVARGEIVNNEDLAEALNNGRIFAGLDVIAPEPPSADHPLFNLTEAGKARLSITPHIAGTTDDAFIRMSEWSYADMVKVMNGERPNNVVNGL